MDSCVICLESNKDIFARITTQSSEWMEGKIQKIIEKHLWWWYLQPPSPNNGFVQWICRQCWQEISQFHNFYTVVEKAHRFCQPIVTFLKQTNENHKNVTTDKHDNGNCTESLNADLVLIKKQLRGRPRKQDKNIKFENKIIDIVDLKAESSFSLNECDNYEEEVNANLYEDACINDLYMQEVKENENCNEMENGKDNTLKHKLKKVILQENSQQKGKANKLKRSSKQKTKRKLNKIIVESDNFFKENQHKLECCICNIPLSDFRSLKVHYRNEHNTQGYSMCCGKKYLKRCLLVDHLRVHTDPNFFKCQSCSKTFETRRGLEMHVESHKTRERKYNCDECGKSYFKLHVFERHKLIHVPESERNFNCSQCDKKFASDYIRRQHEDSTHAKKYAKICDICGKSFCQSYSFLRHMDEHAGAPPSMETCDICGVKLTNKYGLRQHMKMRHLEENLQEQICPYCSRVSPNLNAHRMHIKYSHTMQRKHACHLCDKAFRRPLELKEHLSTHTGEALYTCPHCPRTFISNANMHKHRKIAHRKEWEESRLNKVNKSGVKTEKVSATVGNNITAMRNYQERIISTIESVINS